MTWKKAGKVMIQLTANQAEALRSLCGQANSDGDHEEWLRSAGAPSSEIRATREVMQIVHDANQLAQQIKKQRI